MSLSRAFTTRRTKQPQSASPMPHRSLTTKHFAPGEVYKKGISSPIELISTTNMLSYTAPDLYPKTISPESSEGDLDSVPALTTSPTASTDASSVDSGPPSPDSNPSMTYFNDSGRQSTSSSEDAPVIPKRALSHTKKTHEMLSRKRSQSRLSDLSRKQSVKSVARDSIQMFNPAIAEEENLELHPFGNELAQVTELAEEFGMRSVVGEEEQELIGRGFLKFSAEEYIREVESCFAAIFGDPESMMWI